MYKIAYDSDYAQLYYSKGYRDTALGFYELADRKLSSAKIRQMQKEAVELNQMGEGDQAIFYIKRSIKDEA